MLAGIYKQYKFKGKILGGSLLFNKRMSKPFRFHNITSANGLILLPSLAGQDENPLVKNTYMQIHTYVYIGSVETPNLPSNWPLGPSGPAWRRGGFRGDFTAAPQYLLRNRSQDLRRSKRR